MRVKITHDLPDQVEKSILQTAALHKPLLAVHPRATAHIATVKDLRDQALAAEAHLAALGIAKKDRAGAARVFVSGQPVPNGYKYSRTASDIRLERGASDWFLVHVAAVTIYQSGGVERTVLTPQQRDLAVAHLCAGFGVASPVAITGEAK